MHSRTNPQSSHVDALSDERIQLAIASSVSPDDALRRTRGGLPLREVLFIENAGQARWIHEQSWVGPGRTALAMNAEALDQLRGLGVPNRSITEFVDFRSFQKTERDDTLAVVRLLESIEAFVAREVPEARFDGPGFLTAQAYVLQFAILAVVTRCRCVLAIAEQLKPDRLLFFNEPTRFEGFFIGLGHAPWADFAGRVGPSMGFETGWVAHEPRPGQSLPDEEACLAHLAHRNAPVRQDIPKGQWAAACTRLLMVSVGRYDFKMVRENLAELGGHAFAELESAEGAPSPYLQGFLNEAHLMPDARSIVLDASGPAALSSEEERDRLGAAFDRWRASQGNALGNLMGLDVLPAISPLLRLLTRLGPALIRYADAVAVQTLERVRPHAACMTHTAYLPHQRLAHICRGQGVPVICYQHGGAYGTIHHQKIHLIESLHADTLITFGKGSKLQDDDAFPRRAEYVPLGCSRIQSLMRASSPVPGNGRTRVLWVGEYSGQNLIAASSQMEDIERYELETSSLSLLGQCEDLEVLFRPYPGQQDFVGVCAWLDRTRLSSVRVDFSRPLPELLDWADVVVSSTSADTIWMESIALKKPLVLCCDPRQTPLAPHYMQDMKQCMLWCPDSATMLEAMRGLAARGKDFLAEIPVNHDRYLREYVLGDAGDVAERVARFIRERARISEAATQGGLESASRAGIRG